MSLTIITLDTIATTRDGLREQAKQLNITGRGAMSKAQLADAIRAEVELRAQENEVARMAIAAIIADDEATLSALADATMANLAPTGVTSVTVDADGDSHTIPVDMATQVTPMPAPTAPTPASVFGRRAVPEVTPKAPTQSPSEETEHWRRIANELRAEIASIGK